MPIHQLAFAVGPFTALELGRAGSSRLPFTLWIPHDQEVPGVQFAANFSSVTLDRVEKDLGVQYPLAKLDFVLTRSFPVGGMESWGLIIFHLPSVLLPPREATFTAGRRGGRAAKREVDRLWAVYKVERLVTHELVHQWFGNLVSMAQWAEAWLSEGFATYFTYDFLNEPHPHLTEHEYYLNLIELFRRQSSNARDPLVRRIDTMDDLSRLLGSDSLYSKGAMVVKMLKDLIGTFDFRAGVTRYLNQFATKSVGAKELWSCLPTYVMDHGADQVKIADVMETWLRNRGIPEVTVSRNYDDHSIEITQREADQNRDVVYLEDDSILSNSRPSSGSVSNTKRNQRKTSDEAALTTWEWSRSGWEEEGEKEEKESLHALDAGGELNITSGLSNLSTLKRLNTTLELQPRERKNYHHRHRRPYKHNGPLPRNHHHKHGKRRKHDGSSAGAWNVFNHVSSSEGRRIAVFSDPATLSKMRGEANFGPKARRSHERAGLTRKEDKPRWWSIPFSYAFGSVKSKGGQTSRQFWLLNETLRLVDVGLNSSVPLLANPHWIYPYRVNYDQRNWKLLVDKLHSSPNEVPPMSRMQLLVDGETYVKQSATPELYVRMLAYLATERDLGVLLVGLEQLHSLIDLFSGSPVSYPIMAHLVPVVEQVDKMLVSTGREPELAAIWLLNPQRLVKLYQLRCFANVASCQHNQQISQWLTHPTSIDASNHQQLIAVCHSLYTQAGQPEIALLHGLLRQVNSTQPQWSVLVRMSSCVQDEALIGVAVEEVVRTRNANIYLSVLNPGYSLQHHKKFREAFWRAISKLSPNERQLLFSVGTGEPSERIAHSLLHSIRTTQELDQVEGLLKQWPARLRVHFDYLRRKLQWVHGLAGERMRNYLISLASSPT